MYMCRFACSSALRHASTVHGACSVTRMQARFAWSGPAKARDAKLGKQGEQLQQLGDLRDDEFIPVE